MPFEKKPKKPEGKAHILLEPPRTPKNPEAKQFAKHDRFHCRIAHNAILRLVLLRGSPIIARALPRVLTRTSALRASARALAPWRARALVRWRSRWRVGAWSARVHQARTCFYIRLFFSAGKLQNAIAGIAASPGLRCCAWFCCARLLKSRRQKKRHAHCL